MPPCFRKKTVFSRIHKPSHITKNNVLAGSPQPLPSSSRNTPPSSLLPPPPPPPPPKKKKKIREQLFFLGGELCDEKDNGCSKNFINYCCYFSYWICDVLIKVRRNHRNLFWTLTIVLGKRFHSHSRDFCPQFWFPNSNGIVTLLKSSKMYLIFYPH